MKRAVLFTCGCQHRRSASGDPASTTCARWPLSAATRSCRNTPTGSAARRRAGPDSIELMRGCPPRPLRCRPGLGLRSHRPLDPALPRSARRAEPARHRVRQLPRADRHRRPAGPRHRGHHRRHRRARTHPDRRASPRRHAARPPRRPAHRTPATRTRSRAILRDRQHGCSLGQIASEHRISRSMVSKVLRNARRPPGHEGLFNLSPTPRKQAAENGGLSWLQNSGLKTTRRTPSETT